MLIDWFTVGAQALNFVVLVWLMQRFLYKPVLEAIAAREKRIADQIADATVKQAQAQTERQMFQDKNLEFDRQRAALLAQATADGKASAQQLIDEARKAADVLRAKRQQALDTEAEHLRQAIGDRARQEVFAIARKTLADLATVGLEERIADVLMRRLRELTDPAKAALGDALTITTQPALVRSAFELPADLRAAIGSALNATFSMDIALRFETRADTISGIELSVGGQKLAWSIDDYLTNLEEGVREVLAPPAKAAASAISALT